MPEPWYVEFFRDTYFRFHTHRLTPELSAREADFVIHSLELAPGAQVLDLCCGPGRHALALARRGYAVTGLDLSEPALARARAAAHAAGAAVHWVRGDMRQVPFEAAFDACFSWGSAFGCLESDEEDRRALVAVYGALRPHGKLLIELENHASFMRDFTPRGWIATPDGDFLLEERQFDPLTGRKEATVKYILADGGRRTAQYSIRLYTLAEVARMMATAGLTIRSTWGDLDGSPYALTSHRMIVLAQR